MLAPAHVNEALCDAALEYARNPLGYVMAAYPWGEPGTALENHPGPDHWQCEVLEYIRDNLGTGRPIRIAIAGGVGPGKSALLAWINDWSLSTCVDSRVRFTAATGQQIATSTWPEFVKWHRMSPWAHWFEVGDRQIRSIHAKHKELWRSNGLTWDATNPEAFRGLHNEGKRITYLFDEASAIANSIIEASEGILSGAADTEIIWIISSNPTRTDTFFRTCFPGGANEKYWKTFQIDTRRSRMSDKKQIEEWRQIYGEDHDYFRVNVLSQFPRTGSTQFIGEDLVSAAVRRAPYSDKYDPLILGVDVARFGEDQTVIFFRRGRDAAVPLPDKHRGLDTQEVALKIAEWNERLKPNAIFVDEGGPGAGVVDRCRYLQLPVSGIDFGGTADRSMVGRAGAIAYFNKRAEMWGSMRDWLAGGHIPDDPQLKAELTSVQYGYKLKDGKDTILLERKEDMRKRGLSSPDVADALALTFAYPVAPQDNTGRLQRGPMLNADYDPFRGMFERAK